MAKTSTPADVAEDVAPTPQVPEVLKAIGRVSAALAADGISKDRKNKEQNYSFRGIDDVLNTLARLYVDNNIIVLPRYSNRVMYEYASRNGARIANVTLTGEFMIYSTADGSTVTSGPFNGEAMDTADKATNKAMSAAYKYFAIQTFAIPTEGDNDADATTHEVAAPRKAAARPEPAEPAQSEDELTGVEATIAGLVPAGAARKKLVSIICKAYGVMTLDQLEPEQEKEAIARAKAYVETIKGKK